MHWDSAGQSLGLLLAPRAQHRAYSFHTSMDAYVNGCMNLKLSEGLIVAL
jgi:hypothetical protein